MPKINYIARLNGAVVGDRKSDRTYTHAIITQHEHPGCVPKVATWCGSAELARKASTNRQYVGKFFTGEVRLVAIVPAEIAPSNARTAKAFNDSGVFAPFTVVGKD